MIFLLELVSSRQTFQLKYYYSVQLSVRRYDSQSARESYSCICVHIIFVVNDKRVVVIASLRTHDASIELNIDTISIFPTQAEIKTYPNRGYFYIFRAIANTPL